MRSMQAILMLAAVTAAPALGQAVTPGQWQITTNILSLDMPGAPPQVAAMMKGKPTVINNCITPAQAAAGPREMLKQAKDCSFTRYAVNGGAVDAVMVCKQGGGTMTSTSKGNFTPTSFTSSATVVMTGPQKMSMKAVSSGKRIGACK